jgi:hypothetical protein
VTERHTPSDPWWASGRSPDDGLDRSEDPFDAHRDARRGAPPPPDDGPSEGTGRSAPPGPGDAETGRLAGEALDLFGRLAAEAGRRVAARATANAAGAPSGAFTRPEPDDGADPPPAGGPRRSRAWERVAEGIAPHEDGRVCDACPVCIGLRALRQVRPDVVAHLADAAHHVSLALQAFVDAQAGDDDHLESIDLDP